MRRNRVIWLSLLILSLVGITYYGGIVSYGFFYCMLFVPIISLLYLVYVFFFFRIYQHNDGRTFVVDDPVPYSFQLICEYPLPFVGIKVRFFSEFSTINDLSDQTEYELVPGTGILRETTMVCHYRGEYEIGIKEVEIQDYFRLFRIRFVNRECRRVIVNPKVVFLKNLKGYEMHATDANQNPSRLDLLTREYMPGDDIRFINWNQTAKTGRLMTRERIGEAGNGVAVIFDACRMSEEPVEHLPIENKILELTLALSLFYCSKKIASRAYYFEGQLVCQVVENHLQFDEFYQKLSALHFDKSNTQMDLFNALSYKEEIWHSAVVNLILPELTKYAEEMIENLSIRSIYTVVYLINSDTNKQISVSRPDMVEVVHILPEAKLEEVFL